MIASTASEVRNNDTNALIETYTYDILGNRLTKTDGTTTTYCFHDAANHLTKFCINDAVCNTPTASFTYDLSGNLTARTEGGTTTTYAYDPPNRLAWVGTGTGASLTFVMGDVMGDVGSNVMGDVGSKAL